MNRISDNSFNITSMGRKVLVRKPSYKMSKEKLTLVWKGLNRLTSMSGFI